MREQSTESRTGSEQEWRPPSYWPFVLPALIVVLAVIVFPWIFTIWMSLHEWKVGAPTTFVGLANYLRLPNDPRFVEAVWHTIVYTVLSVAAAARLRHARRRGVPPEIPAARLPARAVHHADDGDAGRDRAGVDHDVPPAARRAELSALARRHSGAALGVPPRDRDPVAGAGRDLAMDAAGDADRARRARRDPDRALRERADRRRELLADVPLHHAAADHAVPVHRRDDPHDRRGEELRHHLRDHAGRAGLGLGNDQPLSLQRRVRLLRRRLRLGDRAGVLRAHRDARRRHALCCASACTGSRPEAAHESRGKSSARSGSRIAVFVIVSPAILFFLWMVSLSLKYEIDNASYPPVFIPDRIAWENYAQRPRLQPLRHLFLQHA